MLKVIIADETQEDVNALMAKLSAFFPGIDITTAMSKGPEAPATQHQGNNILMLQSAREAHFIPVTEIIHVTGDNNYSIFTLTNSRKITVAKTLREYEAVLEAHHFYRIHKSYIINLSYLVKVNKGEEFSVLMSDGTALEVAFRRKADFLKVMQERCMC